MHNSFNIIFTIKKTTTKNALIKLIFYILEIVSKAPTAVMV